MASKSQATGKASAAEHQPLLRRVTADSGRAMVISPLSLLAGRHGTRLQSGWEKVEGVKTLV